MPVTDFLERNSKLYGNEIALVELNPEVTDNRRITWKEYALMQPTSPVAYRREITWKVFDEKPTVLPIFCSAVASTVGTKWLF